MTNDLTSHTRGGATVLQEPPALPEAHEADPNTPKLSLGARVEWGGVR